MRRRQTEQQSEPQLEPQLEPLWRPSEARIAQAAITTFREQASAAAGRDLAGYSDLHAWSVADPAGFWSLYARFAGIPFHAPPERVMSNDPMPGTRWFPGATLNYAEALLYPPALVAESQPALLALDESGGERRLSYAELRRQTAAVQAALSGEGIGPGDRVAAFAANVPETVVLLLACAGLGAIFTSCSPDFGFEAAAARFGQVKPKVLAASCEYRYGGKRFDTASTVRRLVAELGLRRAVALPCPGAGPGPPPAETVPWEEWLPRQNEGAPRLEPQPFDHPLYVLYSSGTTGPPKAIVHRAGGVLLAHHKEHRLHCDIRPGDLALYFTTCGWMMWNWLVSVLAQGATAVLYEGSPAHPDIETLWRLADRHRFTFFGTSARYLHSLQSRQVEPRQFNLGRLRTIASTGSSLSPAGFEFVYRSIKEDVHLASISGGTDIVSCFMLGVPTLPVYSGQIQAPGLAVDLAAFDDQGRPVRGRPAELVCRQSLPSMPLRFWNDRDGERYRRSYFERFDGVWHHGDLVEMTPEGGVVVFGRSDATLNPGGVRIGTAEVYRPLDELPEVLEAAAVGRRQDGDESIWLFVVLAEGVPLDEELVETIRSRIRKAASPRHVPGRVLAVSQLPRTRSGKVMEMAVARVVNGEEVVNRSVIANPEALDEVTRVVRRAQAQDA
ncbi:MAG: acetoacetate--CoA ligase [Trueperaceae bacterium]